jgi:hypothetical protein
VHWKSAFLLTTGIIQLFHHYSEELLVTGEIRINGNNFLDLFTHQNYVSYTTGGVTCTVQCYTDIFFLGGGLPVTPTTLITIYLWLYSPSLNLGRFFSFFFFSQSVVLLGRGISPSQGLYLHIGQHKQNKSTQTSMPQVWFEPTIPIFERAKIVHALDRAATVICTLTVTGSNSDRYPCRFSAV